MKAGFARCSLHRQRGAAGLIAAVFLVLVVSFMAQTTLHLAATGASDSLLNHESVSALYLAESGLERAAAALSGGAICGSGLAGSWSYADGTVVIENLGAGFSTGFDGSALSAGRCRVRVTGRAATFGVQRTIEGIINTSGNLLGTANANFNAPAGACVSPGCMPTGWALSAGGWNDTGGPDGSRSGYVSKPNGPQAVTSAGQYALTAFTITAPATLTLTFDYKMISAVAAGGQTMELAAHLTSGTATYTASAFSSEHTGTYRSGAVTFAISGSGPVTISGFRFELTVRGGQPKQAWLDNLFLAGSGAGSAAIERWREIIL